MTTLDQLIANGLLLGTPIVLAALGGLFSYNARIFNIALEAFMLVGAYFAVTMTRSLGSIWLGVVAGMVAGGLLAGLMGLAVLSWGADEVIVGIALNLFALGLTSYFLTNGSNIGRGFIELPAGLPTLNIPGLDHVAVLGALLNSHDPLVFASWVLAIVTAWIIYRTRFGLRIRASGESDLGARAVGISVWGSKMWTFVLSGLFSGLGGAELALGSVHLFSQDMTSGIGIIAFAAVVFGSGRVGRVFFAAMLFGFAEAGAGIAQLGSSIPSDFVLMAPYVAAIVALAVLSGRSRRGVMQT